MATAKQLKLGVRASKVKIASWVAAKVENDPLENGTAARRWKPGELRNGSELSGRGNKIDPERFVKMAGAMDAALDDMRELYGMITRWSEATGGALQLDAAGAAALLATVAGVTERLRHGLKARLAK